MVLSKRKAIGLGRIKENNFKLSPDLKLFKKMTIKPEIILLKEIRDFLEKIEKKI